MRRTVSAKRAAEIIGTSPQTVVRIIRQGNLRALKLRRAWHVDLESLYAFELQKQREMETRGALVHFSRKGRG
jgi:Helix-turn-helix domain